MTSARAAQTWTAFSDTSSTDSGETQKHSPFCTTSSPLRTTFSESTGWDLSLKTILGTTTCSPSGFDFRRDGSCFVTCAGAVAILNHVDDDLKITQQFFLAKSNVNVSGSSSSFRDSCASPTPVTPKRRYVNTIRASILGSQSQGSPSAEISHSPTKSSGHQRTKAATCVALSPDGKLLAVGETGYNPRILLFYTAPGSVGEPFSILSEHTSGVRCIAFSQDSQWLCSVGDIHDGFILLWSISPNNGSPKLHSSNKCTSMVQDVAWMGGSIVSIGTRHVKVWKPNIVAPLSSPSKAKSRPDTSGTGTISNPSIGTLPGRNCVLGTLLETTFTCIQPISEEEALLCTAQGEISILEDSEAGQRVRLLFRTEGDISCMAVDLANRCVWVGGSSPVPRNFNLDTILAGGHKHVSTDSVALMLKSPQVNRLQPVALGMIGSRLVSIDTEHSIHLFDAINKQATIAINCNHLHIRSHSAAVLGVDIINTKHDQEPALMTWDTTGKVMFWSLQGQYKASLVVPLDQSYIDDDGTLNELRVIRTHANTTSFFSGDKGGTLRSFNEDVSDCVTVRAHQGEVHDISVAILDDHITLIASCGRDRVVQLFKKTEAGLVLLQTLDQHGSSVNQLRFLENGKTLLSSSADRTVLLSSLAMHGDSLAFVGTRVITLKCSPLSVGVIPDEAGILAITTIDKQLHRFDLKTGHHVNSLRLSDNTSSVILASATFETLVSNGNSLKAVVGCSPTDKSVRIHEIETGTTIVKGCAHSDGISDVVVREVRGESAAEYVVISTGLDGIVMIWKLVCSKHTSRNMAINSTFNFSSPAQPVRKVLSKSALADFSRTLESRGFFPLPATPTRERSPVRLRKKLSTNSIVTTSAKSSTSRIQTRSRSPSPLGHNAQDVQHQQSKLASCERTKSTDVITDLVNSTENLARALRVWRKNLQTTTGSLQKEIMREFELELSTTLQAIDQQTRHHQSPNELNYEGLLNEYSDKLTQMVEEKLALSTVQHRNH